MAAGGETFHYIAALNARPDHVAALRTVVLRGAPLMQGDAATEQSACFG